MLLLVVTSRLLPVSVMLLIVKVNVGEKHLLLLVLLVVIDAAQAVDAVAGARAAEAEEHYGYDDEQREAARGKIVW